MTTKHLGLPFLFQTSIITCIVPLFFAVRVRQFEKKIHSASSVIRLHHLSEHTCLRRSLLCLLVRSHARHRPLAVFQLLPCRLSRAPCLCILRMDMGRCRMEVRVTHKPVDTINRLHHNLTITSIPTHFDETIHLALRSLQSTLDLSFRIFR